MELMSISLLIVTAGGAIALVNKLNEAISVRNDMPPRPKACVWYDDNKIIKNQITRRQTGLKGRIILLSLVSDI